MANAKFKTISAKLWFLSLSSLGVLGIMGYISLRVDRSLIESLVEIGEVQFPAVRTMTLADMMHDGIRANAYSAIINSGTKDAKVIKEVRDEAEEFAKNISEHIRSIETLDINPTTKDAIKKVYPDIDEYTKAAAEVVNVALSGKAVEAMNLLPQFDEKFGALEKSLGNLGEMIKADAETAGVEAKNVSTKSVKYIWFTLLMGLVFCFSLSIYFIRTITQSLKTVISEINKESKLVNVTAKSLEGSATALSESSDKQASAIQETAASMDEINSMVQKTGEFSKKLENSSRENFESASKGKQSIKEMVGAIETINHSNQKILDQMEIGNQKINDIVKIIAEIGTKTNVINDIVFQTKLLSFNASVEAARAGEHGKGFAVVAEEVGNLAQMSGNAAKEITDLLDVSKNKVNEIVTENKKQVVGLVSDARSKIDFGTKVASQCDQVLEEIVQKSSEVNSMMTEISSAIHEQGVGIEEISKAIQILDQSTQDNSKISNDTSAQSKGLLEESEALNTIVLSINSMVSGNNSVVIESLENFSHEQSTEDQSKVA